MARYGLVIMCLFAVSTALGQVSFPEDRMQITSIPESSSDTAAILEQIKAGRTIQNADSARYLLVRALAASRAIDFVDGLILSYFHLGYLDHAQHRYHESLANYYQSLLYSTASSKNRRRIPGILNNMGMVYVRQGDYEKGMKYLSAALMHINNLPSAEVDVGLHNNIALTLRLTSTTGAPPDSQILRYLKTAEQAARKHKDYLLLTTILNNQGIFYGQKKDWDKGLEVLRESLEYSRKHHLSNSRIAALNNMATIYLHQEEPHEALTLLKEAMEIREFADPGYRVVTLQTLGETYFQLKELKAAEEALSSALYLSEELEFKRTQPDIHRMLSQINKEKGDNAAALAHYETYTRLRDSLTNKEVARNVHQLEVKYRTSEKDKELILKESRIARQRDEIRKKNLMVIGSVSGLVVLGILLFSAHKNSRQRLRLQTEQIHNLKQREEIIQLKATIKGEEKERMRIARELHDGIVGQLSAVRMRFGAVRDQLHLRGNPDFEDALHDLDDTAGELRKTAHNLMPEIILQIGLAKAIRAHCSKLSRGHALPVIHCYIPDELPALEAEFELSIYRMSQELIQNAIKHARAQNIIVQLDYNDNLLTLTVEDDGIGLDQEVAYENGIGLKNIRSRTDAMNGSLAISSAPKNGTAIYLEFNLMRTSDKNSVKL